MLNAIYKFADGILSFSGRIEKIKGKMPEMIVFVLYAVLHFVITAFHEPWFDEATAWQISRCATLSDILFVVPHYEGHPQLWHLILLPFARLGAPYELSLSLVSFFFSGCAVALIVYKSPFPRVIRWLLPFTYFIFYQYGVISRPYCVMLLAFVLMAVCYQKRNECPGRYALSLALLCATSAFGIVIAGGVALVWLIEVWEKDSIAAFFKRIRSDRRIWWLLALLVIALFFVVSIIPAKNTFATNLTVQPGTGNPLWIRLFYMLFVSLSDVLVTDAYGGYDLLTTVMFSPLDLCMAGIFGIVLMGIIWCYGSRKKTTFLFFVPYIFFGVTAAVLYINIHHIGIVQFLLLFWLWISLERPQAEVKSKRINMSGKHIYRVTAIGSAFCLCVLLVWNISSCIQEITKEYSVGKGLVEFIKENQLDDYKIMTNWQCIYDNNNQELLLSEDTNHCPFAMDIAPYFDRNIICNFADGKMEGNYISHIRPSQEEIEATYAKWRSYGKPDVLLNASALARVWPDGEVDMRDYVPVYTQKADQIWKMTAENTYAHIYVRRELAEELGLKIDIGRAE